MEKLHQDEMRRRDLKRQSEMLKEKKLKMEAEQRKQKEKMLEAFEIVKRGGTLPDDLSEVMKLSMQPKKNSRPESAAVNRRSMNRHAQRTRPPSAPVKRVNGSNNNNGVLKERMEYKPSNNVSGVIEERTEYQQPSVSQTNVPRTHLKESRQHRAPRRRHNGKSRPQSAAPTRGKSRRGKQVRPTTAYRKKKIISKKKKEPITPRSAMEEVEMLRRQQNAHLLSVLEEEQQAEAMREEKRKKVTLSGEKRRIDKLFGVERAKASERIMRITEAHEKELASKMAELNLASQVIEN